MVPGGERCSSEERSFGRADEQDYLIAGGEPNPHGVRLGNAPQLCLDELPDGDEERAGASLASSEIEQVVGHGVRAKA
jgi:hypothetical protein